MLQVAIEERPETRIFAVRHVGPYNQIGRAFQTLHEIVTRVGLRPEALVGIFHDDPRRTPSAQLRSDAGAIVDGSAALPDGLAEHRLPAGRYARTDHVGSYAGLRFAVIIGWNAVLLVEWFSASEGVGWRSRYWYDENRYKGFVGWVILFIAFIVLLDRLVLVRLQRRAFLWRDAQLSATERQAEEIDIGITGA